MEISILDERGYPVEDVRLTREEHGKLLLKAGEHELMMLLRISKYSSDADFDAHELDDLGAELDTVEAAADDDALLAGVVGRLKTLVVTARERGASIAAVGD